MPKHKTPSGSLPQGKVTRSTVSTNCSPSCIEINFSTAFKRDYRRALKGQKGATLPADLHVVLTAFAEGRPLPARCRDHGLVGDWADHRECHVQSDLLLIYRMVPNAIELIRLGSHSDLFG